MDAQELQLFKAQARAELDRLEANSPAKDVAGRTIGKQGLPYIALMLLLVVLASLLLEKEKIAAVMGLLGAALMAVISMVSGVAGANPKQEKPEFEVMRQLIDKLDRLDRPEPAMKVEVEGNKVTVRKGEDVITAGGKDA